MLNIHVLDLLCRFANGETTPSAASLFTSHAAQSSISAATPSSDDFTNISNANQPGSPSDMNIFPDHFGQPSFDNNQYSSETGMTNPQHAGDTTGQTSRSTHAERDSSVESIRSAATAIHQPNVVAPQLDGQLQNNSNNSAQNLREISMQLQGLVNEANSNGEYHHQAILLSFILE